VAEAGRIGQGTFTVVVGGAGQSNAALIGYEKARLGGPDRLSAGRMPGAPGEAVGASSGTLFAGLLLQALVVTGGERRRVAIGRALMNEPDLVLFDEPASALDTQLGDQVVKLTRHEMQSRGTAAVIVAHDERITHYADRVARIVDGRLSDPGGQNN
jgi:hypothetical protein